MKGKVATLVAGLVLGSAGTGLAVSSLDRYEVPRGYIGSFQGFPWLVCANKTLNDASMGTAAPRNEQ
jgi:hypothetical protein